MPSKLQIHFIGIGGIGMSSLAQWYLSKGCKVSGSDLERSEITDSFKKRGVKIFIGQHRQSNLPKNTDLTVYSPAVPKNNSELVKARELKINIMSYPEALGELTKSHYTIAVAGSHGKSTTTAMIALILIKAGLDPTVVVGTKLKEFGDSNFRMGKSHFLVIEACEYDGSFLNYSPQIIAVTNIDNEHMDYFKTMANVKKHYKKFIMRLPETGVLVFNKNDTNSSKLKTQISKPQFKTQNYSLRQYEAKKVRSILKVPGEHNVLNALAALTVARALKIPDKISFKALSQYKGSWRRFEVKTAKLHEMKFRESPFRESRAFAELCAELRGKLP